MFYAWKLNFVLLLRHFLVSISSTVRASVYWQICFNAVFSTSKQLRWTYVDSTFIFNQISTLKYRRNSFNAPSTFFCQRWSNVNKHTLGQLSIPTKFQRWNNVGSATLSRHDSTHVVSTLFCQLWNNINVSPTFIFNQKSTLKQRRCTLTINIVSTLIQRWCVCWVSPSPIFSPLTL